MDGGPKVPAGMVSCGVLLSSLQLAAMVAWAIGMPVAVMGMPPSPMIAGIMGRPQGIVEGKLAMPQGIDAECCSRNPNERISSQIGKWRSLGPVLSRAGFSRWEFSILCRTLGDRCDSMID